MSENRIQTSVNTPDDAMIDSVLEIVTYFGEDGCPMWAYRYEGDRPLSSMLGTIELVKHYLLTR